MAILWRLSRSSRRLLQPRSPLFIQILPPLSKPARINPQTPDNEPSVVTPFYRSGSNSSSWPLNPAISSQSIKPKSFNRLLPNRVALISTAPDLAEGHGKSSGDSGESGGDDGRCNGEAKSEVSWVDLYLPEGARPYAKLARLDKPIGTWLLAWPCMWSITLAADPGCLPDFKMLGLFGCGALLLRGAGCTVNDLLDRDIDIKVDRTKLRPVASGALTPFKGLSFLGLQLFLGLGILLQLNDYSRILGASSLLLVFSYPLMKRFTFWPQAVLGLTFNWGALLGWSAIRGSLNPAIVLPLYISGVCWTLVYDTVYAHQDKEDDLRVGVKSTALRFGDSTKEWITGFGTTCISSLGICGFNADLGWPYYVCLGGASGHLAWQIYTVDLSSRAECNRKFVSNKWFGAIIFSGILLGKLTSEP